MKIECFANRDWKRSFMALVVMASVSWFQPAISASVAVNCPGTAATTDREFTVTTDPGTAVCLASDSGNINGNNDAVNLLGYITLDKTDDLTSGAVPQSLTASPPTSGLSGTFSFVAPAGYTNFVIAFKSGEGQLDPDWAAFSLPNGVTSGEWAISGNQELSHANLYAQAVPVPAAVWLFGSGLLGLVGVARRSHKA
ncbi:MAG: VPLPA-CTERM sorting domain-containing protein [Thiogranum sp.]|jgi:hypothetical protein|nr:VPLPA-CTERM sorting domain-containing protein [Thiogranum sp.]